MTIQKFKHANVESRNQAAALRVGENHATPAHASRGARLLTALVFLTATVSTGCAEGISPEDTRDIIGGAIGNEGSSKGGRGNDPGADDDSAPTDESVFGDDGEDAGVDHPVEPGDEASAPGSADPGAGDDSDTNVPLPEDPPAEKPEPPTTDEGEGPVSTAPTLHVNGRYLTDTCGNRLVIRGVEQLFGFGIDINGSWTALVDEIAKTDANAIRVLPNLGQMNVSDVESVIARAASHNLVVFLSPYDHDWLGRADVKAMLDKYEAWLIIDAFQEPNYDDRNRWRNDTKAAIKKVRDFGYIVPITVLANQYGRDLPSVLTYGAEVAASDSLKNTIMGWQAYWGDSGWYQGYYGMTVQEGVMRSAEQPFPIQVGIDGFADEGDPMDYVGAMARAEQHDVGWLWWDWFNPFGRRDNLTNDGTAGNLTSFGQIVVRNDANGLRSAEKACSPTP